MERQMRGQNPKASASSEGPEHHEWEVEPGLGYGAEERFQALHAASAGTELYQIPQWQVQYDECQDLSLTLNRKSWTTCAGQME
ncbi:hypothetical protein P7K49_015466, partial [Saguinus oedipus]